MNGQKQGSNLPYSMAFLMERYKIRQQSLNEYIKNHIDELNQDGIHARKVGKEWRFDGTAIRILDELRAFAGEAVAIIDYETAETARIKELEQELEEAKAEIVRQKEWLDSQALVVKKQLALLEANEIKIKKAENDALLLSAAEADLEKAEAENKQQADQIAELQADGERKDQAISELEAKLNAELSKGFLEKLKDLFR